MKAEEEIMIEVAEVEVGIKGSVMTITIDLKHQEDGEEVEAILERKSEMCVVVMMMAFNDNKLILTMTIQLKTLSKIKNMNITVLILTQKNIIKVRTKEVAEEEVVATEDVVAGEPGVGIMTIKIKH